MQCMSGVTMVQCTDREMDVLYIYIVFQITWLTYIIIVSRRDAKFILKF